jgi:hypothetical protein
VRQQFRQLQYKANTGHHFFPFIFSMTPSTGGQGTTVSVEIKGICLSSVSALQADEGFAQGVTLENAVIVDDTTITVDVVIAGDATPGTRSISCLLSGGSQTPRTNGLTFTVIGAAIAGPHSQQYRNINLNLRGAHFSWQFKSVAEALQTDVPHVESFMPLTEIPRRVANITARISVSTGTPFHQTIPAAETITADKWGQQANQPILVFYDDVTSEYTFYSPNPITEAPVTGGGGLMSIDARRFRLNVTGKHFQWQYKSLTRPVGTDFGSADNPVTLDQWWRPASQPIRKKVRTDFQDFTAIEFDSFTIPLSYWEPKANAPNPRKLRLIPTGIYTYEALLAAEAISTDKWWQPASEPVRTVKPRQPGVFAIDPEILTQGEQITLDKWFQETRQPLFDKPRLHDYTQIAIDFEALLAGTEETSLDKWFQPASEPRRGHAPRFYMYTQEKLDPTVAFIFADRWYRPTSQPRFDKKRWQYLYPVVVIDGQMFVVPTQYKADVDMSMAPAIAVSMSGSAAIIVDLSLDTRA